MSTMASECIAPAPLRETEGRSLDPRIGRDHRKLPPQECSQDRLPQRHPEDDEIGTEPPAEEDHQRNADERRHDAEREELLENKVRNQTDRGHSTHTRDQEVDPPEKHRTCDSGIPRRQQPPSAQNAQTEEKDPVPEPQEKQGRNSGASHDEN